MLGQKEFKDLIESKQIIAMQGDWTKPDAKILNYLRKFNRFGIPFNAVYGPGMRLGETLPEILTTDIVIDSLRNASKEN